MKDRITYTRVGHFIFKTTFSLSKQTFRVQLLNGDFVDIPKAKMVIETTTVAKLVDAEACDNFRCRTPAAGKADGV